MPNVVMRARLDVADPERQARLGPLQRLALRLLIAAQHQRFVRRVEIEADHIPELGLKLFVVGQFEGPRQVRLDVVGRPQTLHARLRNAGRARHRSAAPTPQGGRRRHRLVQHHAHRRRRQRRFAAAPRRVVQSGKTLRQKALTPVVHRRPRHAEAGRDLPLRHALGPQQDDLGPLPVPHRDRGRPHAALQLLSFAGFQRKRIANHQSPVLRAAVTDTRSRLYMSSYLRGTTLAKPGAICVSGTVRDHIRGKLPYPLEDRGEQNVKNIAVPVRVFALRPESIAELLTTVAAPQPTRRWNTSRFAMAAGAAAAVLVIAIGAWWFWPWAKSSPAAAVAGATSIAQPPAAPRLSIVVLPFANLSNDPDQQYFADGITEDVTTDLSRI